MADHGHGGGGHGGGHGGGSHGGGGHAKKGGGGHGGGGGGGSAFGAFALLFIIAFLVKQCGGCSNTKTLELTLAPGAYSQWVDFPDKEYEFSYSTPDEKIQVRYLFPDKTEKVETIDASAPRTRYEGPVFIQFFHHESGTVYLMVEK